MAVRDQDIEHLLRRAGFGASEAEMNTYLDLGFNGTVDRLVNYELLPDEVDANIGTPGFVAVTSRGEFLPNLVINDARQRWLFRMVHSQRPLQEKMTLFWHNHFATVYSKVQGTVGGTLGTQLMASKPEGSNVKGQIELLRESALGNFRDLLIQVAKDPAMLVWLDGRLNTKNKPQENFARELMELFTMGVGFYTEPDVYAGARVFTGWNLRQVGRGDGTGSFEFVYNASQHETSPKEFSFPIYPDGNRTIPARSAADGLQDGIDLINACARHPETARRLARLLFGFFVSELGPPDAAFVDAIANVYLRNGFEMKPVVRYILTSPQFITSGSWFARYAWPVEFVVRLIKEIGYTGFSVNDALTPLQNMGQQLFEPPDVSGWALGKDWFTTGAMLSRMNFGAALTTNQKFNLREAARPFGRTTSSLLTYFMDWLKSPPYDSDTFGALMDYLNTGGTWTGSDAQLLLKAPGLVHLMSGSAEYQFV